MDEGEIVQVNYPSGEPMTCSVCGSKLFKKYSDRLECIGCKDAMIPDIESKKRVR